MEQQGVSGRVSVLRQPISHLKVDDPEDGTSWGNETRLKAVPKIREKAISAVSMPNENSTFLAQQENCIGKQLSIIRNS